MCKKGVSVLMRSIWLIIMKMRLKIKSETRRYEIIWTRLRHGHKHTKYKMCLSMIMVICNKQHLTLKSLAGRRGGGVNLTLLVVFPKRHLLKRGWNLFCCCYISYYHLISLFYTNYSSIFCIFWHFLVIKKLMKSAYNRWCQNLFTFNIL